MKYYGARRYWGGPTWTGPHNESLQPVESKEDRDKKPASKENNGEQRNPKTDVGVLNP